MVMGTTTEVPPGMMRKFLLAVVQAPNLVCLSVIVVRVKAPSWLVWASTA
jgi:hypothetical protein